MHSEPAFSSIYRELPWLTRAELRFFESSLTKALQREIELVLTLQKVPAADFIAQHREFIDNIIRQAVLDTSKLISIGSKDLQKLFEQTSQAVQQALLLSISPIPPIDLDPMADDDAAYEIEVKQKELDRGRATSTMPASAASLRLTAHYDQAGFFTKLFANIWPKLLKNALAQAVKELLAMKLRVAEQPLSQMTETQLNVLIDQTVKAFLDKSASGIKSQELFAPERLNQILLMAAQSFDEAPTPVAKTDETVIRDEGHSVAHTPASAIGYYGDPPPPSPTSSGDGSPSTDVDHPHHPFRR